MDKLLFGKILGEIYRTQKRLNCCPVDDSIIFGLINGFDEVIDGEIESLGRVTETQMDAAVSILNEYFSDQSKLEKLNGYYDIEHRFEALGMDRMKVKRIFKFLYAEGRFTNVLDKMDSSQSPGEMRTFKLYDYEK